jgi:nucleoside-diphosphate-sugar epimerase
MRRRRCDPIRDEPVEFREFVSAMLATQGVEPPDRSLPAWTALPLAKLSEAAWRLLPLKGDPPMTTFRAWVLTQECTIDISKARTELGYAPVVTREQGLAGLSGGAGINCPYGPLTPGTSGPVAL